MSKFKDYYCENRNLQSTNRTFPIKLFIFYSFIFCLKETFFHFKTFFQIRMKKSTSSVIKILSALWISTYGASVMAPNTGFQPTMIFQNECIAKVQNNTEIVENSVQLKYSFLSIFISATQRIREQGSLKNLDSILEKTCLPATDENLLYDVLMSIIKSCVEQEFSFTPEETVMIKEKLEKIFCNLYLKLGEI